MIAALALILLFQLGGEATAQALALPLPGPVLGMMALVAGLALSPRLRATVTPVADGILAHLSLLFVPAGVGLVAQLDVIRSAGPALLLALVVSSLAAIAVGALTFTLVARLTGSAPE